MIRRIFNILALLCCLMAAQVPAFAQSLNDGMALYLKGNFEGAESALAAASQRESRPAERSKIFKLLGIVQYMQGNKGGAAQSFRSAISINPNISISTAEVLDESILPFFKEQRRHAAKKAPAPARATTLKVVSNARNGSVFLGNRRVASVGEKIRTRPGPAVLTVRAPNFKPRSTRILIEKQRDNNFTLNLQRAAPNPAVAARTKKELGHQPDDLFAAEPEIRNPGPQGAETNAIAGAKAPDSPPPTLVADQPPSVTDSPAVDQNPYATPVPPPPDYFDTPKPRPKKEESDKNILMAFLPFGAGQYYNGDILLGAFFTGGSLASIYFYMTSIQVAEEAKANEAEFSKRDNVTDEQKAAFREDTQAFIKTQQTNNQIAIASLLGLWGIGSLEAYLTMTSPAANKSADTLDLSPGEVLDHRYVDVEKVPEDNFVLTPFVDSSSNPGLALSLNLSF
ncbi:MAG: tol-pal system YbgF family protein [Oligoflexales bacterium]